jgi:hypothetical protein
MGKGSLFRVLAIYNTSFHCRFLLLVLDTTTKTQTMRCPYALFGIEIRFFPILKHPCLFLFLMFLGDLRCAATLSSPIFGCFITAAGIICIVSLSRTPGLTFSLSLSFVIVDVLILVGSAQGPQFFLPDRNIFDDDHPRGFR